MRFYRYLPTAANRALHAYEDGWKEFNLDVIGEARKVGVNIGFQPPGFIS